MRFLRALPAALICSLAAPAAFAAPPIEIDGLQRNGALSRHVWRPDFARAEVGGLRVSAGVAIGLRGAVRDNLDRRVAPALSVELDRGASLSLLAGSGSGAMLVWQAAR